MHSISKKPVVVKLTVAALGALALLSWLGLVSPSEAPADKLPAQWIAEFIRVAITNAAFIGILSNTRVGRFLACLGVVFISLALLAAAAPALTLLKTNFVGGAAILLLPLGGAAWVYCYIFSPATKEFYREVLEASNSES